VELLSIDHAGMLTLIDTRPMARAPLTVLHGHDREMYLACDDIAPYDSIARTIVDQAGSRSVDPAARLALMVARGGMIRDGQRYLALAVPLGLTTRRAEPARGVSLRYCQESAGDPEAERFACRWAVRNFSSTASGCDIVRRRPLIGVRLPSGPRFD